MLFIGRANNSLNQPLFSPDFRNGGSASFHSKELLPSSAQKFNYTDGSYMNQSLKFDGTKFHWHAQMYDRNHSLEVESTVSFRPNAIKTFDFNDQSTSMVPDVYQLIAVFHGLHSSQAYTAHQGHFGEQVGGIGIMFSDYDQIKPFTETVLSIIN